MDPLPKEKNNESPPVRKPISWMQLGAAAVLAAILAGAIHYSLTYQHQSAFEDERAFRVLEELVAQIRNLQLSRATLLNSLPPRIKELAPRCDHPERQTDAYYTGYIDHLAFSNTQLCSIDNTAAAEDPGSATAHLKGNSSPTADPQNASKEGHASAKQAPAPASAPTFQFQIMGLAESMCRGLYTSSVAFNVSAKDDQLTSVRCGDPKFVLQESLEQAVSKFISQDFFDEAILTFADGTVIGEFPMQSAQGSSDVVVLHHAIADRLNMISAKAALHPPAPADDAQSAKQKSSSAATSKSQPSHLEPFAWNTTIAEQAYRVSVFPFNAPYSVAFPGKEDSSKSNQDSSKSGQGSGKSSQDSSKKGQAGDDKGPEHLYIIGLHRVDWRRDILHALWPTGLWAAVLFLSLNLVGWPLISLAFGPAEESISVVRAVGSFAGLILIPALLIIATASLWSDLELQSWMRGAARDYATAIGSQLRHDLVDGGRILTTYRAVYGPFVHPDEGPPLCPRIPEGTAPLAPVPLRASGQNCDRLSTNGAPPLFGYFKDAPLAACLTIKPKPDDVCEDVRLFPPRDTPVEGRWSPFRSIIALNVNGDRFGPALSPFSAMHVSPEASIPDREYFQALKAGQAWVLESRDSPPVSMVAQRLYNRGDGSKALQLAVPLCDPRDASAASKFCGIITGDIRTYGLTSPVSPPLLKFAVIDTTTGTVIFSSTDTRSLAENFFQESEQDPALLAVIKSHHEADFTGRYLGEPQRFSYTPISNVPWGVLVFYSTKELADLPFRAGSAAVVCYVGLLLFIVVVLSVIRWLYLLFAPTFPRPLELLKAAWPTLPLTPWYRDVSRFRPSAWGFLVVLIGMLSSLPAWATLLGASAALVAAAYAGVIVKPDAKSKSTRTPTQQYSQCLLTLVTAVSIIPAYALFVEFYQLQYEALIRDGLSENAVQMQSRYDAVHEELRRLMPPDGRDWDDPPDSTPATWSLTLQPNTGMSDLAHELPRSVSITPPSDAEQPLRPTTPYLHQRLVWEWTASSSDQERRLAIIAEPAGSDVSDDVRCGLEGTSRRDTCIIRMSDGSRLKFESRAQHSRALFANEFDWWWLRFVAIVAAVLFAAMGTSFFSWLITTRLFGVTDKRAYLATVTADPAIASQSFEEKWEALNRSERLALYQIARGELINPRNFAALEKPLRADMIRFGPWPVPKPPELKDSILHAERDSDFLKWQRDAGDSTWRTIRGPLFIVIMVVIAWLSWAAGGSMKALMAILVATAAFLGQIVQLVNFARGSSTTPTAPS
jgi:hypothetical protein